MKLKLSTMIAMEAVLNRPSLVEELFCGPRRGEFRPRFCYFPIVPISASARPTSKRSKRRERDAEADHKRALIDGCALPATHPYSSAQDPA